MELFLLLLQIPLLIFIIKYIRKLHSDPLFVNAYYYLLSFKVTAGLVLGVLYFSYYKGEGDTVYYFHSFDFLSKAFYSNWEEYMKLIFLGEVSLGLKDGPMFFLDLRAYTFVRIISPIYILSGSNYWICSIYLSIFSFSGLWILSNSLIKLYKLKPLAVLISFFIFPSVVFWSSGIIKESLIIGVMCIIITIVLNLANHKKKMIALRIFVFVIFSCILFYIKFYYFAVLFSVLTPYALIKYFTYNVGFLKKYEFYSLSFFLLSLLFMAFIASYSYPLLHFNKIFGALYLNYSITLEHSSILNSYTFEGLSSDPVSFLSHIPKALFYGLFSPFLWQCKSVITMVNGIENTILLILFITFLLTNFRKEKLVKIDIEVISLVVYVATLAIFMAFASPNWGSLVRYKVGYLPFFLLLILNNNPAIIQLEKMFSFLNRSEKKS